MQTTTHQEATLITLLEQVLNKVYPSLRNFPKHEKYVLSQAIRNYFIDSISSLHLAIKVPSKRVVYAQEADAKVSSLKVSFRLAFNQKYINQGYYEELSVLLTRISNLLNTYIKTTIKMTNNKKLVKVEYNENNKTGSNAK